MGRPKFADPALKRSRPTFTHLTGRERQQLDRLAQKQGLTRSSVVREAVVKLLAEESSSKGAEGEGGRVGREQAGGTQRDPQALPHLPTLSPASAPGPCGHYGSTMAGRRRSLKPTEIFRDMRIQVPRLQQGQGLPPLPGLAAGHRGVGAAWTSPFLARAPQAPVQGVSQGSRLGIAP
jgi:hypothetical protein